MPSFSFLKSSRRESQQVDRDGSASLDHDNIEKGRGTPSKREYLRSLIRRAESLSNRSSRGSQLSMKTSPYQLPTSPPTSPRAPTTQMFDPNKPLPPRPAPGKPEFETPAKPTKPTKKLERIMSPIALDDLHKIFSGAPQFLVSPEDHYTGAPHPSVAFPWNSELETQDLCDYTQIEDNAWGCVTAWPHITLQASKNPEAAKEPHRRQRAHSMPWCRELPNMLSMQGIERGTTGWAAALEMEVADALREPGDVLDQDPQIISEHRRKFLSAKEGLRPLTDSALIDRLMNVSETYFEDHLKTSQPAIELYTELFTQILFPPTRVTDSQDPYSLQVQIEALVQVLAAPHVWIDFGLVESRIRLGEFLWSASDMTDEISINNVMYEPGTQRYWLLVQILLSCELLLRLDTIFISMDHVSQETRPLEFHQLDREAKTRVRWSLVLARQWFENIRVVKKDPDTTTHKKTSGWLATLTRTSESDDPKPVRGIEAVKFEGRNQDRQLLGLLHFARKLQWPDLDDITAKVSSNGIVISESVQSTPAVATPLSISTQRSSSYFSVGRPGARRGLSSQSVSAFIQPAGWLSNTYISGLVLPGEPLGHFLISTLLEHDEAALSRLGDEASLYGGFIYGRRSFWSKACITGRVLAARKGALECMGWISSDCLPRGVSEGWVDIEAEPVRNSSDKRTGEPRIRHKTVVEKHGSVTGGADTSSVLPGDFVLPSDESLQKHLAVTFESLDLFATSDPPHISGRDTPTPLTDATDSPKIQTYSAMIKFTIEIDGQDPKSIDVNLNHDVNFVTAHPCIPSHANVLKSPTSPSFHTANESPMTSPGSPGSLKIQEAPSGHPLHKAFTYSKIPIANLLSTPSSLSFSSLLSPPQSPDPTQSSMHTTSSSIPKVLVVDCTDSGTVSTFQDLSPQTQGAYRHNFGSDLEMLARAICAERGWNALVSRRGRSCLSCAVREASTLNWQVILRLA